MADVDRMLEIDQYAIELRVAITTQRPHHAYHASLKDDFASDTDGRAKGESVVSRSILKHKTCLLHFAT